MKRYSIKFPKSGEELLYLVRHFLGGGGFIVEEHEWFGNGKADVEFVVICNDDTEFADLMIEVGKRLAGK